MRETSIGIRIARQGASARTPGAETGGVGLTSKSALNPKLPPLPPAGGAGPPIAANKSAPPPAAGAESLTSKRSAPPPAFAAGAAGALASVPAAAPSETCIFGGAGAEALRPPPGRETLILPSFGCVLAAEATEGEAAGCFSRVGGCHGLSWTPADDPIPPEE